MIDNTDDAPRRGLGALLRTRRRKVIAGGVTAVLLVGAGTGVAVAATRNDDSRYRTASAERADVTQTLALTGQLSSSKSVSAAFQVSGTVGKVLVDLGDDVTAGQTLARLDKTSLKNAVTSADDALANAKQQLENDLEAQSSGSSSTSSSTNATSTGASSDSSSASTVTKAQASSASAASATTPTDGAASTDSSSSPSPAGSNSTSDKGTGSGAPIDTASPGSTSSSDSAAIAAAKKKVTEAQQALLDQYAVTTEAQTDSAQAAADAQTVCTPFLDATISSDGTITPNDTGTDTTTDSSTATTDGTATDDASPDDTSTDDTSTEGTSTDAPSADGASTAVAPGGAAADLSNAQSLLADCQSSISDTLDKQQTTSHEQQALQKDVDALDDAVTALVTLVGSGGSQTSSAPTTPAPSASSTSSSSTPGKSSTTAPAQQGTAPSDAPASTGSAASTIPSTTGTGSEAASSGSVASSGSPSGGASGQATTVTAEQILADRAAIEAAEADVSVAEQDLEFATLTSPISGKVVSVAMAAGDQVSAASTTAVITVQGDGGYVMTSTVSLSKVATLEAGQTASVALPAFGKTYTGSVTSIGVQNVSETSTPSYSVTVAVEAGDDSPRIGATARATISVATAQDVLTVPTSAITVAGSNASVLTLKDGEPVTTAIEIGAVGAERVEVTKGLSAGDEVVLADLDQQITSDSDDASTGLSGLTGSTGGSVRQFPGGFSGGGFPGGGQGGFPSR